MILCLKWLLPYVLLCFTCLACLRASRASCLTCFTCLVPYVLSGLKCLVPYVLSCPSCLSCFRCLIPDTLSSISYLVPPMSRASCVFDFLTYAFFFQPGLYLITKGSLLQSFFNFFVIQASRIQQSTHELLSHYNIKPFTRSC